MCFSVSQKDRIFLKFELFQKLKASKAAVFIIFSFALAPIESLYHSPGKIELCKCYRAVFEEFRKERIMEKFDLYNKL
jgi:hypothetical protein